MSHPGTRKFKNNLPPPYGRVTKLVNKRCAIPQSITIFHTSMSGSNNSAAARSARCAQRGDTREQQEQDAEVTDDPDLISVHEVQGQNVPSPPTDGNQLKVMVHNVEADEMPAAEYTAVNIFLCPG